MLKARSGSGATASGAGGRYPSALCGRTVLYSRRHRLGDVSFISLHSSERTTINGYANAGVDAHLPLAGRRFNARRGGPFTGDEG